MRGWSFTCPGIFSVGITIVILGTAGGGGGEVSDTEDKCKSQRKYEIQP